MSLRSRLTLLYSSLVGGLLLLFGVAVYISVSSTVAQRLDDMLTQTAQTVIDNTTINSVGQLMVIQMTLLDLPADVYLQVWDREGNLRQSSANISQIQKPLDPTGLHSQVPVKRDSALGSRRLRVLTVPLEVGGRIVGDLQVATNLDVVLETQRTLLAVLLVGIPIAISVAAFAFWFTTRQLLSSLEDVTQVALQITKADDLSRRIPYNGPPNDEIGQLIRAFNQTLGRLETLFETQRRFLADVGHELRTPLTVIKGNVNLMRHMGNMDDESLESIESEADRLTRLVGDLLLLAQAESGKIPMDNRLVELDTLLLEAMSQMDVLTHDRLHLHLGEIDQVLVCGDRDRLKQVLVNLIANAINYTPQGGEVVVGLAKLQNQARLTVSDNGPGISPEDLPHIFERFYRGEKSRTRARGGKGFGLGLSIAYWIVRNHDGRIDVDSKVGVGTTFCVWLPLAQGDCQQRAIQVKDEN